MKKTILLFTIMVLSIYVSAQVRIQGKVINSSEKGLTDASIIAEWADSTGNKKSYGIQKNDGSYEILTNLPCTLTIEKEGYLKMNTIIYSQNFRIFILKEIDSGVTDYEPLTLAGIRKSAAQLSITVLNSKEINLRNGVTEIPNLLYLQPSITTTSDAGNNIGYAGIRIRGTDATRINVTMNGVPLNDAESQGVWWVNMPALSQGLNSIQISRGIGSSANGAGAFGGNVSLETADPANTPSQIEAAFASFGSLRTSVNYNQRVKNLGIGIGFSNVQSDGYIERATSNLQSKNLTLAYYMPNSRLKFVYFDGAEKTDQAWYGLSIDSLKTNRRYNKAGEYLDKNGNIAYYRNQTDNYSQKHYQLFYDKSLLLKNNGSLLFSGGLHYTKGQGFYEEFREKEYLANYAIADTNSTNLVRQLWLVNDFYGAVYTLKYFKNNHSVVFGGNTNFYMGNHFGKIISADKGQNINFEQRYYDNDAVKKELNHFLKYNYEYRTMNTKHDFSIDFQLRGVDYKARGVNDNQNNINIDNQFLFFNPKIGYTRLTKQQDLNTQQFSIFAGMASREPSRGDLLSSLNIVKPEQMFNGEFGYAIGYDKWGIVANYFMMYYQNQLVLTGEIDNVGASKRANVSKSYRTGLELIGKYQMNDQFSLNGNLTLMTSRIAAWQETIYDYEAGKDSQISYKNTQIAFTPNIIYGITANYKILKNTAIVVQNKLVGRQFLDNTSSFNKKIPAFYTLDLILNHEINYQHKKGFSFPISISIFLNNITNHTYFNNGWAYNYLSNDSYQSDIGVYPQAGFNGGLKIGIAF